MDTSLFAAYTYANAPENPPYHELRTCRLCASAPPNAANSDPVQRSILSKLPNPPLSLHPNLKIHCTEYKQTDHQAHNLDLIALDQNLDLVGHHSSHRLRT